MTTFFQQYPLLGGLLLILLAVVLFAMVGLIISLLDTRKKVTPYDEGMAACKEGMQLWRNPYSYISKVDKHKEWESGWVHAKMLDL